jgi:hypothetical protein
MLVGNLPRTRLTGLPKFGVISLKVMYKQSRQLANVKIHIIHNIPYPPPTAYSLPKFMFSPHLASAVTDAGPVKSCTSPLHRQFTHKIYVSKIQSMDHDIKDPCVA